MSEQLKPIIAAASERNLDRAEAEKAFDILFEGQATQAQIGGFLMALRTRGETTEEYAAAAHVMRSKAIKITAPEGAMDIVGTGGDGKHTLNISTATAFVVAGCGVPIAKHGNRNLSSKSGTADVQTSMGIDVMVAPEVTQSAITKAGIGFMMAPIYHPAIKHVMAARLELGTRTLFNILGPLTNPAGVKMQLTGAYERQLLKPMAQTLKALGSTSAWLVHGSDGTDELTITGSSWVCALKDGAIDSFELTPEDAGLSRHPFEHIIGGTPDQNAQAFRALLQGEQSAYRDAVLLNSAAALKVSGRISDLKEGAQMAAEAIDSGAAQTALDSLIKITSRPSL